MDGPLYRCDICLAWKLGGNDSYYHWSGGPNSPDQDGPCCKVCAVLPMVEQIELYWKSRKELREKNGKRDA